MVTDTNDDKQQIAVQKDIYFSCPTCKKSLTGNEDECPNCGTEVGKYFGQQIMHKNFMENINAKYNTDFQDSRKNYCVQTKGKDSEEFTYLIPPSDAEQIYCIRHSFKSKLSDETVVCTSYIVAPKHTPFSNANKVTDNRICDIYSAADNGQSAHKIAVGLNISKHGFVRCDDLSFSGIKGDDALCGAMTMCEFFTKLFIEISECKLRFYSKETFDLDASAKENNVELFVKYNSAGTAIKEIILRNLVPLKKNIGGEFSAVDYSDLIQHILKNYDVGVKNPDHIMAAHRFFLLSGYCRKKAHIEHINCLESIDDFKACYKSTVGTIPLEKQPGQKKNRFKAAKDVLLDYDAAYLSMRNHAYAHNNDDFYFAVHTGDNTDKNPSFVVMAVFDGVATADGTAEFSHLIAYKFKKGLTDLYKQGFEKELLKYIGDKKNAGNIDDKIKAFLNEYIVNLNFELTQNARAKGLASTLALALIVQHPKTKQLQLFTAHLGDSRIYVFDKTEPKFISHDHTILSDIIAFAIRDDKLTVAQLHESKDPWPLLREKLSESEIIEYAMHNSDYLRAYKGEPLAKTLTRLQSSLGNIIVANRLELTSRPLGLDSAVLVASDGAFGRTSPKELASIVDSVEDCGKAVHAIANITIQRKMHDNCTIILMKKVK